MYQKPNYERRIKRIVKAVEDPPETSSSLTYTTTFDVYGRLQSRHLPEQLDADGHPRSTAYAYNPDDTPRR
jgi:hypothetical protein